MIVELRHDENLVVYSKNMAIEKSSKKTSRKLTNKKPVGIIPKIKQYLTHEMQTRDFENETLKSTSAELIDPLLESGDIRYFRSLVSIQSIYQEKIFWAQIQVWREYAFDGDTNAEALLQTTVEGFKSVIFTYKDNKKGRPAKFFPHDIDIPKKYNDLNKELIKNTIHNDNLNEIRECKDKQRTNPDWGKRRVEDIVSRRKKYLKIVIDKMNLKFSEKQIDRLVHRTNADIAYNILAKSMNTGVRRIKEELAKKAEYGSNGWNDDRTVLVLKIQIADGRFVSIDHGRFGEERLKAHKECDDPESTYSILSNKLGVPIEAIRSYYNGGDAYIDFRKARTRHLPQRKSKKSKKS
ncbi:MAG: hypothetical protein CL946_13210 [Ectothiorhodospiraceae bacterium]|nr:hypothetical protein [Ectothiorhodospiraceae bacterium]